MFKCNICESTFTRERDMRRHKKTVHGKSTGVCCDKCNKTFTRADNLKKHEKVCCKCRRCNKQFETLNLLNNHHCIIKEAPPMKNSVAVNNGKFIYFNGLIWNERNCFS